MAEYARAAELVAAAPAPTTRAGLAASFAEVRPRLRLTDEAIVGTTNLLIIAA